MPKVLHILWSPGFGGIAKLVLDLIQAQQRLNMKVGVCFAHGEGEFFSAFEETHVPCYICGLRSGFDISPSTLREATKTFNQYDILHFHNFNLGLSIAAKRAKKKIIYTEHGNFGLGRTETWQDKLKYLLAKRFLNRSVNQITFNSRFTQQMAVGRYGLKHVAHQVVYNGVQLLPTVTDSARIEPALAQKLAHQFVIATTSRFAHFKRIDRLIRAFATFQKDRDTVLLLVGDGILRAELEALVKDHNIESKTIFTGFQPNVSALQNVADVCVFPSQQEPFGLVAVETLSLGKPTIVFEDGGGIKEIIPEFDAANIVQDEAALVERLTYYYHASDIQIEHGAARKEHASQFDIAHMADQFSSLYASMVAPT